MKKGLNKNETQYIRKCKQCKSTFIYDEYELYSDYYSEYKNILSCPYCRFKNKIHIKVKYKNNEEIQEDYKELLKNAEELRDYYKSEKEQEYKSFSEKLNKLERKLKEQNVKLNRINDYVDNYLDSDKANNLAIKYFRELQKIIKE